MNTDTLHTLWSPPRIFGSSELHGLTGDQGERFCVFIRRPFNPLESEWLWRHTREEAEDFCKKIVEASHGD